MSRRERTQAMHAQAVQDIAAALARNHPSIPGTPAAEPAPAAAAILAELRNRPRGLTTRQVSRRVRVGHNLVLWHLVSLRAEGLVRGDATIWLATPPPEVQLAAAAARAAVLASLPDEARLQCVSPQAARAVVAGNDWNRDHRVRAEGSAVVITYPGRDRKWPRTVIECAYEFGQTTCQAAFTALKEADL